MVDSKKITKDIIERAENIGYILKDNEIESFAKKHKIRIEKLKNKATLIGNYRDIYDSRRLFIEINFLRGAYDDPKENAGIMHLYEHLVFSKKLNLELLNAMSSGNGSTSAFETIFTLNGVYNSDFPDFSLGGSFSSFLQNIFEPDFDDNSLSKTVATIINELSTKEKDFEYRVKKAANRLISSKESSSYIEIGGNKDSLLQIKSEDVKNLSQNFATNEMIVVISFDGFESEFNKVFDFVKSEIEKYSRISKKENDSMIDPVKFNMINPDLLSLNHDDFNINIPVDNGLVYTGDMRIMELMPYSPFDFSLFLISPYLNSKLHIKTREAGHSYRSGLQTVTMLSGHLVLASYLYENSENWKESKGKFLDLVYETLSECHENDPDLIAILDKEKIRQQAIPITGDAYLSEMVHGLKSFGRPANAETIREYRIKTSTNNVSDFIKKIKDIPTKTYLFGKID